jgi:hypothetical protein
MSATREATARRAALAERLEEQRRNFQRDLLLDLQDELQRVSPPDGWGRAFSIALCAKQSETSWRRVGDTPFPLCTPGPPRLRRNSAQLETRLADLTDRYTGLTYHLGEHLRRELDRQFDTTAP